MRYDFVVSDFDGTLRTSNDTITPRTVAAIRAFTEKGGTFAVSTGRAYASIAQRLGELGLVGDVPVLCCQGALMRGVQSGKTLQEIPMQTESAAAFLQTAESLDLMCHFYTADAVYAVGRNERNDMYFARNRIDPVPVRGKVSEFARTIGQPILKVLCLIDPSDRQRLLQVFGKIPHSKVFASHPMLLEAVSENAGKGNGLLHACARLHIAPERSVAIGDELNDIEMLRAAGLGVAVGNAVAEAKAAAGYITADCDHDGVAEVLEKIVRGEL